MNEYNRRIDEIRERKIERDEEEKLDSILKENKEKYGLNVYLYENLAVKPRAYMESGRGEIVKYSPNEIEIVANAVKHELLFLSDRYYPGWKAYVDGKEVKILRANNFFRSIKLEPGVHKVRFVYDPLSLKIGAAISIFTIMGLALGGLIYFRKNK